MKFLVTGADGLLGSNLVRELLANGHEVRVLLYPKSESKGLNGLEIERVYGDIASDQDSLDRAIQDCEGVFHCAAITDLLAPLDEAYRVNVMGTRHVMDSCLKHSIKRLVFVGSASSFNYGSLPCPGNERGGFAEDYIGVSYMESKYAAMKLVQEYVDQHGLDAVIVAPTFMIGQYDTRPSSGELIRQHIQKNLKFTAAGGRNFVHVKDVARGMLLAFENGKRGEVYILGSQNLSYAQFFEKVNQVIGRNSKQITLPRFPMLVAGLCSDLFQKVTQKKLLFNSMTARIATLETYYTSEKAVTELGMPQTPIEVAIEDALKALKEYGHIEC